MWLEDFGGSEESTEQLSWWQEWVSEWGKEKVSQAEISQVEKQQKKAKQIRWKIAQKKKNDTSIASFIAFLMKKLDGDIVTHIFNVFFIEINKNTGSKQLPTIIHGLVLSWLFAPFYHNELHKYGLGKTFDSFNANNISTFDDYLQYVPKFVHTYSNKINLKINTKNFLTLLYDIVLKFKLIPDDEDWEYKKKVFDLKIKL